MTLEMNAATMKRSLHTLGSSRFSLRAMLALFVLLAAIPGFAQQETYNWLFGQNAWIQFPFPATGSGPTSPTGSALSTGEGSSSISDSTGKLLFYTDGVTVWDKNHHIMTNGTGLNGNASSTNSALIVPCSCGKYFIFTTDAAENHYVKGLQYSVVDLSSGSVVSKNTVLLQPASERVAAISDGPGKFWVVAHGMGSNRFYAWHVTPESNCDLARVKPVISAAGTAYSGGGYGFGQGQMKISPDHLKLAVAGFETNGSSFLELFSFNAAGVVANLSSQTIRDSTPTDMFYGVEFSPNSKYLYATATRGYNKLYQYSALATTNNVAFTSSKTVVHDFQVQNAYQVGALQLGPDNKIYVARVLQSFLSALDMPNSLNPTYVDQAVQLASGTSSYLGLPAMVAGTFPCETPPPVDTCCPPWNSDMLKKTMFYQGSGGIGASYTLQFHPTATLNTQMLAYLNLLNTTSGITSITITFNLIDLNTNLIMEGPKTATWTWSSGVPSPGFFNTQMNVNHWYRVDTLMSLNGNNHFSNEKCIHNWIDVNIQVQGNLRIMQTRSPDGSVSERRINSNSEREIQQ